MPDSAPGPRRDPDPTAHYRAQQIRRAREHRTQVLYAADRVNLAVFHQRPHAEIMQLLTTLAHLTRQRRAVSVLGLLGLLIVLFSAELTAQSACTANCTAQRNEPFSVAADHDGVETDGYRLRMNGALVREVAVSQLVNGVVTIPFTVGLSQAGVYRFTLTAYNSEQESDPSAEVVLTVRRGKPAPPTQPRITK